MNNKILINKILILNIMVILVLLCLYITFCVNETIDIDTYNESIALYVNNKRVDKLDENKYYDLDNYTCTNNVKVIYDTMNRRITLNANKITKCSLYFNEKVDNFYTDIFYTGSYSKYVPLYDGYYLLELWGAQGGGTNGGRGSYTSGVIELKTTDLLYVYVGGKGGDNNTETNLGGYNGGGYSGYNPGSISYGGGGSTDIRYFTSTPSDSVLLWNSSSGLNSRIMVAAGGAGTVSRLTTLAGEGGDLYGGKGTSNESYNTDTYLPLGGTPNSAGYSYENVRKGSFGQAKQSNTSGYGGGGGGGYYAGSNGYGTTGAGGSSFISGYAGVNAIVKDSTSEPRSHTNNTLHYSGKYFIDGKMKAATNIGNGKAKITFLGNSKPKRNTKLNNIRYIKDCTNGSTVNTGNFWLEVQAVYNGNNIAKGKSVTGSTTDALLTDGLIANDPYAFGGNGEKCITIDLGSNYNLDEVAVWRYWLDGRTYFDNELSVSTDNITYSAIYNDEKASTHQGERINAYSD